MQNNIIGPEALRAAAALDLQVPPQVPPIPFPPEELAAKQADYLLILGLSRFADGTPVTVRTLRARFGMDPAVSEPCFYNQDWYEKEAFIDRPMEEGWFLIRRRVWDDSRAVQPAELMKTHDFPTAVRCAYAFFAAWFTRGERLWEHDFVWCSDTDHNGDRIYVGKYEDVDGVNKNGFSVHRHLALRPCYGCL